MHTHVHRYVHFSSTTRITILIVHKVGLGRDCKKRDQHIYSRNAQGFMCNMSAGDLSEPTKKVLERHKDFPLRKLQGWPPTGRRHSQH